MEIDLILEINKPVPQFVLPDLGGGEHALVDYLGRIVIVNFWSAECPWVKRVDQDLLNLVEIWGNEVVLLPIASNANEGRELLMAASESRGLPFLLLDEGHLVADLYGALTTPHFFVIDRAGRLRYQGAFDDVTFRKRTPQAFYLKNAIEALLSGGQPDPELTPPYGCTLVRFIS